MAIVTIGSEKMLQPVSQDLNMLNQIESMAVAGIAAVMTAKKI